MVKAADLKSLDVDELLALRGDVEGALMERARDLERQIALVGGEVRRHGRPPGKGARASALKGVKGKRGKTGGGMNLRFTGGHESDSFWECCRPPTSMAYRTPI